MLAAFRRIPSLRRLVVVSVLLMIFSLCALVGGLLGMPLLVPPPRVEQAILDPSGKPITTCGEVFQHRPRLNILVLGIDYNHDEKSIIHTKGARSDTMMVVSLSDRAQFVNLVSIPRDTYVLLSEALGSDRINAAFSYGGVQQAQETIGMLLGVPLHKYVMVKVYGAKKMIDALGGLWVEVEKDMDYDDNWGQLHIHLKKGPQLLNGEQLVGYARFRKDEEGDWGRMRRQQQVIRCLLDKLADPAILPQLPALARAARETIETDLTVEEMLDLAHLYHGFNRKNLHSAQLTGTDEMVGEAMVIVPSEYENGRIVKRLLKDGRDLELHDMTVQLQEKSVDQSPALRALENAGFGEIRHTAVKTMPEETEVVEYVHNSRLHKRLKQLFPQAKFRDGLEPQGEMEALVRLGTSPHSAVVAPLSSPPQTAQGN